MFTKTLTSALAAAALVAASPMSVHVEKRNTNVDKAVRDGAPADPTAQRACNITYTFVNNTVEYPTGGTIALSSVAQFPALIDTNVAGAVGFVNPCGLNTPHMHPRANELLTVVQGTLVGGLILEQNPGNEGHLANGTNPVGALPFVNATLSNYTAMLFPIGSVHWQFNPTCEPAVFTAAFDNSDPGRTQIARNFFSIDQDAVLESAVGGNLESLDGSQIDKLRDVIPAAYAELMESCAVKCGLIPPIVQNGPAIA